MREGERNERGDDREKVRGVIHVRACVYRGMGCEWRGKHDKEIMPNNYQC